ncbi:hypothetical protein SFRURICE_020926 [Spodoptera frugiperda]|nr:hypothetical protein SFRURICE_020926 [Spodoptera frugiperda]
MKTITVLKGINKNIEEKLRLTLKELEKSKHLCSQLLQEREDSEVEVKTIVDKNASLKNELAELHVQYMDVLEYTISTFQDCSNTHEAAFQRITEIESELCDAHRIISYEIDSSYWLKTSAQQRASVSSHLDLKLRHQARDINEVSTY